MGRRIFEIGALSFLTVFLIVGLTVVAGVLKGAIDQPANVEVVSVETNAGIEPTSTEKVRAMTELLVEYQSQRATGSVAAPISCEALLAMIQAAQAVYIEQCPGL